MDRETAEAITGAYGFARSILAGVILDLQKHGASDKRIEELLGWIDRANEKLEPAAQRLATEALAGVHTALRVQAQRGTPPPDQKTDQ